jgi:hypothetical protein
VSSTSESIVTGGKTFEKVAPRIREDLKNRYEARAEANSTTSLHPQSSREAKKKPSNRHDLRRSNHWKEGDRVRAREEGATDEGEAGEPTGEEAVRDTGRNGGDLATAKEEDQLGLLHGELDQRAQQD